MFNKQFNKESFIPFTPEPKRRRVRPTLRREGELSCHACGIALGKGYGPTPVYESGQLSCVQCLLLKRRKHELQPHTPPHTTHT